MAADARHSEQVTAASETCKDRSMYNPMSTTWRTVFLIGKAGTPSLEMLVENEAATFGDILLGDYRDTYRNLTLKVVHGLQFAARACCPAFLLKTDDDCFVNTRLIVTHLLKHNAARENLYVGNVQKETAVVRNPRSKWHVLAKDFRPSRYPPYPSGTGYIMSGDVLARFASTAVQIKPFPNEDAYVGVVMSRNGIIPLHSFRFTLYSHRWQYCNYLYLMVIHHVHARQQVSLYNNSLQAMARCPGQPDIRSWS